MSNIEVYDQKNKYVVAVLAFLFGVIGAHRFYLGQTGLGVLSILFFWTGIPTIVGVVDFIIFLSMEKNKFDYKYNPLLFERRAVGASQSTWNMNLPISNEKVESIAPKVLSVEDKLLSEVDAIQKEILDTIQSSKEFNKGIVSEIKPLVNGYIDQVRELIDRDKQIKQAVETHSVTEIDDKIFDINSKLQDTSSELLKIEYRKSLERYINHKKSLTDFYDQREVIALRLDATLMSLREVKFDLLRLQNLTSEEQKSGFFDLFDSKSTELSDYLSSLKEVYAENRLSNLP